MADDGTRATETARGIVERVEPTKAQRAAARRVAESKATAPHLYLEIEIETEPGYLPRLVAAVGGALREVPTLNGAYRDGAFETQSRVNVGVVLEGPEAPVIPTVFDADTKGIPGIEAELARLRERARAGELTSPELAGGTFTITAVEEGQTRSVASILNQGQAGALAAGAVRERPAARGGSVAAARVMCATLSCDARIVTAEVGARFLERVRVLMEKREAA